VDDARALPPGRPGGDSACARSCCCWPTSLFSRGSPWPRRPLRSASRHTALSRSQIGTGTDASTAKSSIAGRWRVFYFLDLNRDGVLVIEEIANVRPEAFRAADGNGAGKLSLEEYVNARFKDFEAIDANGDGVITKDELDRWLTR
jgi:hypothetical protein